MTRRISLITAMLGAALAFAAPAWADTWGAASNHAPVRVSPDLADRAAAALEAELTRTHYAREDRAFAAKRDASTAVVADPVRDDRFRLDPSSIPVPVSTPSSGRELEWPQLGIGFAVGVLLVIGLLLAIRMPRMRQHAH